jgi:hypothetical protein
MPSLINALCLAMIALGMIISGRTAPSTPETPETPSKVTINGLAYGGSGCPQGSASALIAGKILSLVLSLSD